MVCQICGRISEARATQGTRSEIADTLGQDISGITILVGMIVSVVIRTPMIRTATPHHSAKAPSTFDKAPIAIDAMVVATVRVNRFANFL